MSVIKLEEIGGREGSYDPSQRVYKRSFQAETDTPLDGPKVILDALYVIKGITIGTPYLTATESDPWAVATRVAVSELGEDGREWAIAVDYGRAPEASENPLLDPAEIDIEGREFETAVDRDTGGNLIVNSAGDPFDPPITIEENRVVVTITRAEAFPAYVAANPGYTGPVYDYADIIATVGKSNSDTFLGFGPKRVRSLFPRITRQFNANIGFYAKVTYRFEVLDKEYRVDDPDNAGETILLGVGHDRVVLDQGFRELVSGEKRLITLDGQPLQEPALLDGEGSRLPTQPPDGSPPETPPPPPKYLTFQVIPGADFNGLEFNV